METSKVTQESLNRLSNSNSSCFPLSNSPSSTSSSYFSITAGEGRGGVSGIEQEEGVNKHMTHVRNGNHKTFVLSERARELAHKQILSIYKQNQYIRSNTQPQTNGKEIDSNMKSTDKQTGGGSSVVNCMKEKIINNLIKSLKYYLKEILVIFDLLF